MQQKAGRKIHIVVIGGGKGTSRLLLGLKKYPVKISAILSTADNGSSSGKLRKDFNMVPPGDMRQCLVALAENKEFAQYCSIRFGKGNLYGHPLGNILLALLFDYHGDIQRAVDATHTLLGIHGHEVLPATLQPTTLVATLADRTKIMGEAKIVASKHLQRKGVRFSLLPKNAAVNPRACAALKDADAIIVGPGNLFASTLPALLPDGIRQAIVSSRAKKIFVTNLMTQRGHTEGFSPADFVDTIETYLEKKCFDVIFYNTAPVPRNSWHKNIGLNPVRAKNLEKRDARFSPGKFVKPIKRETNDPIASLRSLVLHDEDAIAQKIFTYLNTK